EAAHIATDRAPGLGRRFAFERWPDFDADVFTRLLSEARARVKKVDVHIEGADRHEGALALARRAAEAAAVAGIVKLSLRDARDFIPSQPPAVVVVNPPWGERLGEGEDLVESWRALGHFLHHQCAGAAAFVLSGNPELTRHLGLRATHKTVVMTGPIECRWIRYDVDEKKMPAEAGPGSPTGREPGWGGGGPEITPRSGT